MTGLLTVTATAQSIRPSVLPYSLVPWVAMAVVAVLNGGFREIVLVPRLGSYPGHVVSTLVLVVAIALISFLYFSRAAISFTRAELVLIGVVWVLLTTGFEFLVGNLEGTPVSTTLGQYNVLAGQIWILVPLTLLVSPLLFGWYLADWLSRHVSDLVQCARGRLSSAVRYASLDARSAPLNRCSVARAPSSGTARRLVRRNATAGAGSGGDRVLIPAWVLPRADEHVGSTRRTVVGDAGFASGDVYRAATLHARIGNDSRTVRTDVEVVDCEVAQGFELFVQCILVDDRLAVLARFHNDASCYHVTVL